MGIRILLSVLFCLCVANNSSSSTQALKHRKSPKREVTKKVSDKKSDDTKVKGTVTHVTLTCYHPVAAQCDSNPLTTADGSKIDLHKLKHGKIKWCAISRDLLWMFPKGKPKRVHISGRGIYEVKDVMNSRFDHRIDVLLHPSEKDIFFEKNVKVTILS